LLWVVVVLGIGGSLGVLVGGMGNPLLLIGGIAGLAVVILMFQDPEWALLALVFITYTMLTEVLVNTHGAPSLTKPVIALLLLLLLARWFLRGEPPAGGGVALVLMIGYVLLTSLSLFYAGAIDSTLENISELVKNAAIAIIVTLMLKCGDALRRVSRSLLVGGLFLGTISSYQYLTGTFTNEYWGFGLARIQDIVGAEQSYRIGGPIGDPNFYGQMLLFVVPLAVDCLRYDKENLWRLIAACALAVTLLSIAFTFSRGTFLAAGIILLLMLVKDPPRPAVTAAILALTVIALLALMPQYLGRMLTVAESVSNLGNDTTSNLQDDSIQGRLSIMHVALKIFLDHPLLGIGLGNFEHYYQQYALQFYIPHRGTDMAAHSLYLEIAAERGLLGLAVYLVLIWYIFRIIMKSARQLHAAGLTTCENMVFSYGYSLLGYLATSVFLHERARFIWIIYGICLSFPAIAAYETRRVSSSTRNEGRINEEFHPGLFSVEPVAGNDR
jgi:putative inorganic carbon (HCO3(-)) transporter